MKNRRKIKAREAAKDIRSGMNDRKMMKKYGLSSRGLQSLVRKLLAANVITQVEIDQRRATYHDTTIIERMSKAEFIEDIHSGMSDLDLMEKYALSGNGLRRIFRTLIESNAIRVEDVSLSDAETVAVENPRGIPRQYLAMAVNVYEAHRPEINGILSDIGETGIGTSRMKLRLGDVKSLVIPAEDFIQANPIMFEAQCLWAEKEKDTGEWFAGLEITRISERCREDLQRLIRNLPFLG